MQAKLLRRLLGGQKARQRALINQRGAQIGRDAALVIEEAYARMGGGVHIVAQGQLVREGLLPQLAAEQRRAGNIHFRHKVLQEGAKQAAAFHHHRVAARLNIHGRVKSVVFLFELLEQRVRIKAIAAVAQRGVKQIARAAVLHDQPNIHAAARADQMAAQGVAIFGLLIIQRNLIGKGKPRAGFAQTIQKALHGGNQLGHGDDFVLMQVDLFQRALQMAGIGNAQRQRLCGLFGQPLLVRLAQAAGNADAAVIIGAHRARGFLFFAEAVNLAAGHIQGNGAADLGQKFFFHGVHLTARSWTIRGHRGRQSPRAGSSAPSCRSRP